MGRMVGEREEGWGWELKEGVEVGEGGKNVGAGFLEKKGGRIGFFGNVEVVERLGGLKEPVKPFELINGVGKG